MIWQKLLIFILLNKMFNKEVKNIKKILLFFGVSLPVSVLTILAFLWVLGANFFTVNNTPNNNIYDDYQANITNTQPTINSKLYLVDKVVDGDTLDVKDEAGESFKVRLIGINTPETVDPRRKVECFGKEASNKAKEILSGKKIKLENDLSQGDLDKYGRSLRYVFLENGINFNLQMISEGYAYEYTYKTPYKYQDKFKQAQKQAEELKVGLWADNTCAGKK